MLLWLHSACGDALPAPSCTLRAPVPARTAPVIAVTLLPREGGEGCPPPQCTISQSRRMPMDSARAQQFLRENENAVLATWRRDGRLHMSPVTVGLDGAGRAIISSQDTTPRVGNFRPIPGARLGVSVGPFGVTWFRLEATAESVTLPDAMKRSLNYTGALAGAYR